jgi:hypothetical protein
MASRFMAPECSPAALRRLHAAAPRRDAASLLQP